ncbi:unnamed protein product [Acanthosepion pharaonis]|uniref:Uncharacterized protein n=1 Tax=Acanthosepion pharaonis TaxID=158019 RepID=A0A812BK16_ACAPH|nr:unnamed protein product [Sepia pharaonis]
MAPRCSHILSHGHQFLISKQLSFMRLFNSFFPCYCPPPLVAGFQSHGDDLSQGRYATSQDSSHLAPALLESFHLRWKTFHEAVLWRQTSQDHLHHHHKQYWRDATSHRNSPLQLHMPCSVLHRRKTQYELIEVHSQTIPESLRNVELQFQLIGLISSALCSSARIAARKLRASFLNDWMVTCTGAKDLDFTSFNPNLALSTEEGHLIIRRLDAALKKRILQDTVVFFLVPTLRRLIDYCSLSFSFPIIFSLFLASFSMKLSLPFFVFLVFFFPFNFPLSLFLALILSFFIYLSLFVLFFSFLLYLNLLFFSLLLVSLKTLIIFSLSQFFLPSLFLSLLFFSFYFSFSFYLSLYLYFFFVSFFSLCFFYYSCYFDFSLSFFISFFSFFSLSHYTFSLYACFFFTFFYFPLLFLFIFLSFSLDPCFLLFLFFEPFISLSTFLFVLQCFRFSSSPFFDSLPLSLSLSLSLSRSFSQFYSLFLLFSNFLTRKIHCSHVQRYTTIQIHNLYEKRERRKLT